MNDAIVRASFVRALRTAIDYIIGSIPAGVVITPAMIESFDFHHTMIVVIAWLATGLLTCGTAFLLGIRSGLPEVEPAVEYTDEDVENLDLPEYKDEEYDDLYIDDEVEDGEVEQEE